MKRILNATMAKLNESAISVFHFLPPRRGSGNPDFWHHFIRYRDDIMLELGRFRAYLQYR